MNSRLSPPSSFAQPPHKGINTMSNVPLEPKGATQPQGDVPGTGSLEAVCPSRTEGDLPPMPAPQSTAPEDGETPASPLSSLPASVSTSTILTRGLDLARPASPQGAV